MPAGLQQTEASAAEQRRQGRRKYDAAEDEAWYWARPSDEMAYSKRRPGADHQCDEAGKRTGEDAGFNLYHRLAGKDAGIIGERSQLTRHCGMQALLFPVLISGLLSSAKRTGQSLASSASPISCDI